MAIVSVAGGSHPCHPACQWTATALIALKSQGKTGTIQFHIVFIDGTVSYTFDQVLSKNSYLGLNLANYIISYQLFFVSLDVLNYNFSFLEVRHETTLRNSLKDQVSTRMS